jgi:hypothetical protein
MLKIPVAWGKRRDKRILGAAAAAAALMWVTVSALAPVLNNPPKPAAPAEPTPPPSMLSQAPTSPSPQAPPQAPSSPAPSPIASPPQAPPQPELAMREALDPRGRYAIDFPGDWAVRWIEEGSRDAVAGLGPAGADGRRVQVLVDMTDLPAPMSAAAAATYAETGLRRLTAYRSLSAGPSTIGGVPGYLRIFTHTEHGALLFEVQGYVTRGRQFYIVGGSTRTGKTQIPRDVPVILHIIGTFRLLPPHALVRP